MYYRTRAIIIKNRDFRETDKLVTIFSEQQGKITAIARGIKKPASSLRACVQPFCHSLLFLNRGKGMDIITQGSVLDFYGNCREDLKSTLYIMYMLELLDKTLMENVPIIPLYNVTQAILELFNQSGLNVLAIRYFETVLLNNLGYRPVLTECVRCGSKQELTDFSISEGGMLCSHCLPRADSAVKFSGEMRALVQLLNSSNLKAISRVKVTPRTMKQLETFLEQYLEYHLERKFYVKDTIRTLKNSIHLPD